MTKTPKSAKAKVSTKPKQSTMARSGSSKIKQKAEKAVKPKNTVAMLDEAGVEEVSRRIIEGESMTAIATSFGIGVGSLRYWVSLDISRSARVREARSLTGAACDDEALNRIDAAEDAFQLAKAREAAQHLRWRAKAVAPREYGDKIAHGGDNDAPPIKMDVSITPDEAYRRLLNGG